MNKAEYLRNPDKCPFCGSDDIWEAAPEYGDDKGRAESHVFCVDCEKEWFNVYAVIDIRIEAGNE